MSEVSVALEDGVAWVRLSRPAQNNAVNDGMRAGLMAAFEDIAQDPEIRVVVLESEGEEAFSVGLDMAQLSQSDGAEAERIAVEARMVHDRLTSMDQPVIAAVKGACFGAGLELALHCDIRFARQDATLGLPGVNIGTTPGGGTLWRLQRLIGAGPASALALTGGVVSAERAFMLGLVTNVLAPEEFEDGVQELADHLASLSPTALGQIKNLLRTALGSADDREPSLRGIEALRLCFDVGDAPERIAGMIGGPGPETTLH